MENMYSTILTVLAENGSSVCPTIDNLKYYYKDFGLTPSDVIALRKQPRTIDGLLEWVKDDPNLNRQKATIAVFDKFKFLPRT